jgi:hypothetical protein
MNNTCLSPAFLILCAVLAGYCQAEPSFTVHIDNQLKGSVYNQPITITYDQNGGPVTHVIQVNEVFTLRTISSLRDGSEIIFKGYGDLLSYTIQEARLSKADLINTWNNLKGEQKSCPLTLKVTSTGWFMPYQLVFTYTTQAPENSGPIRDLSSEEFGNPFMFFPGFQGSTLHTAITPDGFLSLQRNQWKKVLVPAGYVLPGTTAEDFSRSILGLPKQYDYSSLINAKTLMLSRWKEGQQNFKTTQFIKLMRQLILKATDILEQALIEKSVSSDWQEIEKKDEERGADAASSSSTHEMPAAEHTDTIV